MRPLLIGLTGKAGAGKDTAGHFLNRTYGFELYALAWPLKSGIEAMFDLPSTIWGTTLKEQPIAWLGKSPRELAQTLGTEWGRKLVHPEVWVRTMIHRWEAVQTMDPPRMCVTDVRFDNEAEAVKRHRGVVVNIVRPSAMPVSAHASEAGIAADYVDFTVLNDGSLTDLHQALSAVMERLLA